jgi:hypothetical protein
LVCQVAEVQGGDKQQLKGLLQVLGRMMAFNRKQEGVEIASAVLDWVLHAKLLKQARQVYNR